MEAWRFSSAEELGAKRVAGCCWSKVLHAASSGTSTQQLPWKTRSKVFYRISSWHTVSPYTLGRILVRKEEGGHLFLHFLNKWSDVWILQEGRTFTKHPWTESLILVTSEQLVQSVAFAVKPCKPGAWQRLKKSREKSTPSRARLRDMSAVSKQHQQEESLDDFQARLTSMRPKIEFSF